MAVAVERGAGRACGTLPRPAARARKPRGWTSTVDICSRRAALPRASSPATSGPRASVATSSRPAPTRCWRRRRPRPASTPTSPSSGIRTKPGCAPRSSSPGPLDIPNGTCWIDDALTVDACRPAPSWPAASRALKTSPFAEGACGRFFDHLPDGGAGEQAVTLLPGRGRPRRWQRCCVSWPRMCAWPTTPLIGAGAPRARLASVVLRRQASATSARRTSSTR